MVRRSFRCSRRTIRARRESNRSPSSDAGFCHVDKWPRRATSCLRITKCREEKTRSTKKQRVGGNVSMDKRLESRSLGLCLQAQPGQMGCNSEVKTRSFNAAKLGHWGANYRAGNQQSQPRQLSLWSGRRESNPCPKLGKLLYCHCTTPAPLLSMKRFLRLRNRRETLLGHIGHSYCDQIAFYSLNWDLARVPRCHRC